VASIAGDATSNRERVHEERLARERQELLRHLSPQAFARPAATKMAPVSFTTQLLRS